MWRLIGTLLDFILPRKGRVMRLAAYSIGDLACDPRTTVCSGEDVISLMSYRTPAVEDCIRALKYDGDARAAALIAETLGGYLAEEITTERTLSTRTILLVPVPLHSDRERERGFNHVLRILEHLPARFTDGSVARIETRALMRTRATAQQAKLPRAQRLENVKGAFSVREMDRVRHAHVFLIDDVVTTGATLHEAARPLKESGVPVTIIALARA